MKFDKDTYMCIYIMEYMAMDDDILLCVEMGCSIPISGNFNRDDDKP